MTKGRRLRLDRRRAGLSQEELAKQLGHTEEEISAMENDRLDLSSAAAAFSANMPARVPRKGSQAKAKPEAPQKGPEERVEEQQEGPGPRVELPGEPGPELGAEPTDRPPRGGRAPSRELAASRGEIAELEDALLKMFAGERLIVPRQTPDGVIQVQAVIPGIAQVVGMYDEFDGQVIETYSPGMAKAWAELARVNPAVRRVLIGLTYGGAYRGVLAASLPPLLAILVHHGAIPGFGRTPTTVPIDEPPPPPQEEGSSWNGGVPEGMEPLFEGEAGFGGQP